jgi:dTDP-4-amino-4,6-dideoxygalactose transaminase
MAAFVPQQGVPEVKSIQCILGDGWLTTAALRWPVSFVDDYSGSNMALYFDEYIKRFSGRHFFYGNATHAFRDVMAWLGKNRPTRQPNIIMPEYIPAKLYRVVLAAGYTPKFYEIYEDCEFDLEEIRSLVDDQTLALFVVHYFGLPSKLDAVRRLATSAGVYMIEDCAHTICAQSNGAELGTVGDCSLFSVRKMLVTPEGGFLVLNKEETEFVPSYHERVSSSFAACSLMKMRAKRAYSLLAGGKDPLRLARLPRTGYINFADKQRINVKNVSLVTEAYTRRVDLAEVVERRRSNYEYLLENIKGLQFLRPLRSGMQRGFTPYSFPVRTLNGVRDKLRARLLKVGISCGAGWPESPFEVRFTRTAALSRQLLEFPIHHGVTRSQLERIVECLHGFGRDVE